MVILPKILLVFGLVTIIISQSCSLSDAQKHDCVRPKAAVGVPSANSQTMYHGVSIRVVQSATKLIMTKAVDLASTQPSTIRCMLSI
jgi:hypothetical protein